MNNSVKAFIEDYIDVIDSGDFIKMYDYAYENMYDNEFVRSLTQTLERAGLEGLEDARYDRLYAMVEDLCSHAILDGSETNLHRLLDNENNWYGYTVYEVINFIDQMSYNLGIELIKIDDRIFRAPNYFIKGID